MPYEEAGDGGRLDTLGSRLVAAESVSQDQMKNGAIEALHSILREVDDMHNRIHCALMVLQSSA